MKKNNETELGKLIFHTILAIMKNTLNLEEFSYRESGREDPRYRTFKKHLMESTYTNTRKLLADLEDIGLLEATNDGENVKNGYQETQAGGSGYINSKNLNDIIKNCQKYNVTYHVASDGAS